MNKARLSYVALALVVVLTMILAACSPATTATPAPQPTQATTQPPVEQPTTAPEPTQAPEPTAVPEPTEVPLGTPDQPIVMAIAPSATTEELIASGETDIYFNRLFYQAANEPKELWELPGGEHGAAILKDSQTYIQRVVEFFNGALL